MDSKLHNQLEEARVHFRSWRLLESYHILRRYFDRLPFQPEKEHAEYIGMFVRVLLELGKEFELKFYMKELERLYQTSRNPHVAYSLGMVYFFIPEPRMEAARNVFEGIVKDPSAREFYPKAKMMLACYYDAAKRDVATCRLIIESIEEPSDPELKVLLQIWKAKILRDENRLDEAEAAYRELLSKLVPEADWYACTTISIHLTRLYLVQGDLERAEEMLGQTRALVEGKRFKSLEAKLADLERALRSPGLEPTALLETSPTGSVISFANRRLCLRHDSNAEKLLLLLLKRRSVDKSLIVDALYHREYRGESDDKLVYYHVHSLRKRLRDLGMSSGAIAIEPSGYRLTSSIQLKEEELS